MKNTPISYFLSIRVNIFFLLLVFFDDMEGGRKVFYNVCLCPGVYPVPQRTRLGPIGTQNNKGGLKLHFLYTTKPFKEKYTSNDPSEENLQE